MPNYNYKCYSCGGIVSKFLPISTDPAQVFVCELCPDGALHRYMGAIAPSAVKGFKVFAGDWFKKTYGHELGEDGMSAAEKKADYQKLLREHEKGL